jgi:hypothetical protein
MRGTGFGSIVWRRRRPFSGAAGLGLGDLDQKPEAAQRAAGRPEAKAD